MLSHITFPLVTLLMCYFIYFEWGEMSCLHGYTFIHHIIRGATIICRFYALLECMTYFSLFKGMLWHPEGPRRQLAVSNVCFRYTPAVYFVPKERWSNESYKNWYKMGTCKLCSMDTRGNNFSILFWFVIQLILLC